MKRSSKGTRKTTDSTIIGYQESEGRIYGPDETEEFIRASVDPEQTKRKRGGSDRPHYLNIPAAFDIETTSFLTEAGEKRATMYVWQLGINGRCMVGRTWEDFINVLHRIQQLLGLSKDKRMIIYVHNLAYEFQFLRGWIESEILSVFALDQRKPVKVLLSSGIEFRCSYILTGYSLATVGKNLLKYKVEKKTGDLDYNLIRHAETPLSEAERGYCINDIRVVMAAIQEKIEQDGDITKIPLTKTGYVRNLCRKACYQQYEKYRKLMFNLQLRPEEYKMAKLAFAGGFTHASALNCGRVFHDVGSYDFTSSYPTVMVAEMYPMNYGEEVQCTTAEDLKKYTTIYLSIFEVRFYGLEAKTMIENPISESRCQRLENAVVDNGRVYSADMVQITITNVDFDVFQYFYRWESMSIRHMTVYRKNYLPTPFVKSILTLYDSKTKLKGVEGMEAEYLSAKENINSAYGMCAMDIVKDEQTYSGGIWGTTPANIEEAIDKYNNSKNRFLSYLWGVFVTAYARRNLFLGIKACIENKATYLYSDTDSLKVADYERISGFIAEYNQKITRKLEKALEYHNLDVAMIRPKTITGKEKPLGVWDWEGAYDMFKTLGAKRYMTYKDGELSITVSGVNKRYAIPWLLKEYKTPEECFAAFEDGLIFPEDATGKMVHTYIDEQMDGILTDYTGKKAEYHEKSGIHLSSAEYHLGLSKEYINFLKGYRDEEKSVDLRS